MADTNNIYSPEIKNKYNLNLVGIVAIVAIVGIVLGMYGMNKQSKTALGDDGQGITESNLAGGASNSFFRCTDSDGGKNIITKGTTRSLFVTRSDFCITQGQKKGRLDEFYCQNDKVYDATYGPEDGCVSCNNGVCFPGFENYPNFLIDHNHLKLNAILVVGDAAPAEDVIAVSDIIASLGYTSDCTSSASSGSVCTVRRIDVGSAKLASEVKYPRAQNLILVGRPTKWAGEQANVLIDRFALPELLSGQSLLKIAQNGNYYAVIVTGKDQIGPRQASKYLVHWKDYKNILKGTEVKLVKDEDITVDSIQLFPPEYLIVDEQPFDLTKNFFYADVYLRNRLSDTLYNVRVDMSIPKLGLIQSQVIETLPPDFGKPTPNQFRIDIPTSVVSGRYEIIFTINYNVKGQNKQIVNKFEREISQPSDVKCSDSDGTDYYIKGFTKISFLSGYSSTFEDACCINCDVAPSESGPFLLEFVCEGNKRVLITFTCPHGCKNGACITN